MSATNENAVTAAIKEYFDAGHGHVENWEKLSTTANMSMSVFVEDTLKRGVVA